MIVNGQIVTGYMTSVLMTFVMLSILNMYDVLSAKALSNLPTTTFMHEEEVMKRKQLSNINCCYSPKSFMYLPFFTFFRNN
jgi:hypothetical protein